MANTICNLCKKKILQHSKQITCTGCKCLYHLKCITLDKKDQAYFLQLPLWLCKQCLCNIFPFNCIDDDDEFIQNVQPEVSIAIENRIFTPFELNEENFDLPVFEADPDFNFYHDISHIVTSKCNYYREESFNKEISKLKMTNTNNFSICHINIRSAKKNIGSFVDYLSMLNNRFSVIGLSETWLTNETSDLYTIEGYTFESVCRQNRSGGGVALCLKMGLSYVLRNDLCFSDEYIECVCIEISGSSFNLNKNVIVAVIYRPPNTNMSVFNDKILTVLDRIKIERKICYLSGDFNIDCLKSDEHRSTSEFLNLMYSHFFIPLITRPTRVASNSATLIDNIYTNNLRGIESTMSGLLTTDISDHYPIFHIYPDLIEKEKETYFLEKKFKYC